MIEEPGFGLRGLQQSVELCSLSAQKIHTSSSSVSDLVERAHKIRAGGFGSYCTVHGLGFGALVVRIGLMVSGLGGY